MRGGQIVFGKPKLSPAAKPDSKPLSKIKKIDGNKTNLQNKIQPAPILFEENKGQFDKNVKFLSRGKGFNTFLNSNETIFQIPNASCERRKPKLRNQNIKPCTTLSLTMKMFGANTNAEMRGIDQAVTKSGYFIGNDQSKWLNDINNYNAVRYEKIYKGIDVVFRGVKQNLEYDFHIAPEADPNLIQLEFEGAKKVKIDRHGDLIFRFKDMEIRHQKPLAYQIVDGERKEVSVKFISLGKDKIGFEVGEYNSRNELIIDPVIYASYLGGTAGGDGVYDIAVDRNGNIYTASNERISPAPWTTYSNILIIKFNPDGNIPIYRKSYGGAEDDIPLAMDVDVDGKVYLTGITFSTDFPLRFADQSSHAINEIQRDYMAFVMRLYEDGDIHYSTYLGGGCAGTYTQNYAYSIAADFNGNAYVTGYTCSSNFPVRNGFQMSLQSDYNAFLTKYDSFGHIAYSTYFGGSGSSSGTDIATDRQGNVYVTGSVPSGLYTTPGAYKTSGLGFAAKFDTNKNGAQSLIYSTYIDTGVT